KSVWRRSGVAAPDLPRGRHDELQLAPLIVHRKQIAGGDRREAALRAEREMLERHVSRGRIDPPAQIVLALEARFLRRDEPQHHVLAAGNETQRLKGS